jgi:hypothetical protein
MMYPPCGMVGPSPRSGEAVTPPRSRLSPSPRVGRGGDRLPRSRWSPSPRVGRGGDRLPGSRLSLSPGVGRGGDRLPGSRLSPSPGVGRGGDRLPGSGEAELPMAPEAGLGCCQPHPGGWHSSRSRAGGAVLLSGQSVEGRSDCGHFGRLRSARQDKVSGDPCIECSCDAVGWRGDLAKVASLRSLPELGLGRVEGAPVT